MDAAGVGEVAWDVVIDDACDAGTNMALDDALLNEVASGNHPPTVRVYGWSGTSLSVGRFQDVRRTVNLTACRAAGVSVVRRPTGGRGVLHGSDLTISVATRVSALGSAGASVRASHRLITSGLSEGLARLGIGARSSLAAHLGAASSGDCFATMSSADLADCDGRKIVGGAQCRRRGALLEQVSVLHRPPLLDPSSLFCGAGTRYDYPLAGFHRDTLRDALLDGLLECLGVSARRHAGIGPAMLAHAKQHAHAYAVDTHSGM